MPFDFGGALGGIGSFIGNQVGSALSSARQWHYTKDAMYLQYKLNRLNQEQYYQRARKSLESAGYNPLLAVGSGTQGGMPSASMSATDSDAGDQAINSALSSQNLTQQNKLLKSQTRGQDLDNSHKELENKRLQAELDTSAQAIISDIINGKSKDNKTIKALDNAAKFLGIDLGISNSAISSKPSNVIRKISIADKKPYIQKGVPRSVVRNFNNMSNSAVSSKNKIDKVDYLNSVYKNDSYGYYDILKHRPHKTNSNYSSKHIDLPKMFY